MGGRASGFLAMGGGRVFFVLFFGPDGASTTLHHVFRQVAAAYELGTSTHLLLYVLLYQVLLYCVVGGWMDRWVRAFVPMGDDPVIYFGTKKCQLYWPLSGILQRATGMNSLAVSRNAVGCV